MVYCADIGSVKRRRFAWASSATGSNLQVRSCDDIQKLVTSIVDDLKKTKVALGFECPLWVPVRDDPEELTSARDGEGNRSWSAAAGASSLATGLTEIAWILDRVRRKLRDQSRSIEVFLEWDHFRAAKNGLFIWEAFVTGQGKSHSHKSDAKAAVNAFIQALQTPCNPTGVTPQDRTRSLIGAALLWAGWSENLDLLNKPCVVIKSAPRRA